MEKTIQLLMHILITAGVSYLLICVIMFLLQDKMIFYPPSIDERTYQRFKFNEIVINREGNQYHGWRVAVDDNAEKTLVYFGGNAEDVVWMNYEAKEFEIKQMIAVNYPGYGYSNGKPTEQAMYNYANEVLKYIKSNYEPDENKIIILGRSIGSSVASYLVSKQSVSGLIMITPFDSVLRVAETHYPFLPVSYLLKYDFPALEYTKQITKPVLQIMAMEDEIIRNDKNELSSLKRENIKHVKLDNVGHNSIQSHSEYYPVMNKFINSL